MCEGLVLVAQFSSDNCAARILHSNLYERPHLNSSHFIRFVAADSPYIHSYGNLSTAARPTEARPKLPKWPLHNDQLIKRLTKSWWKALCFTVKGHKTWSVAQVVGVCLWLFSVLLIYFRIVLGIAMLQWDALKINRLCLRRNTKHITTLSLHSGHLSRTASFPCPQD